MLPWLQVVMHEVIHDIHVLVFADLVKEYKSTWGDHGNCPLLN